MRFSGDSISGFDRSREMYSATYSQRELRRLEEIRKHDTARPTDTIEPAKERMNRQVPYKTGEGERALPFIVGRAGRFVFMAVALPPYLALYAMPKWIAATLAPKIIEKIGFSFNEGMQAIKRAADWVLKQALTPFRHVSGLIRWARRKIETRGQALYNMMKRPFSSLRAFVLRRKRYFEERKKSFNKRYCSVMGRSLKWLKGKKELFHRKVVEPIAGLLFKLFALLARIFNQMKRLVLGYAEKVSAALLPVICFFLGCIRKAFFFSARQYGRIFPKRGGMKVEAFLKKVAGKILLIFSRVGWGKKRLKAALWQLHLAIQRGVSWTIHQLKKMEAFLIKKQKAAQMVLERVKKAILATPPLPQIIRLQKFLHLSLLRLFSSIKRQGEKLFSASLKAVHKLLQPLASFWGRIKQVILSPFSRIKGLMTRWIRRIRGALVSFFKGISLLGSYFSQLCKELSEEISSWSSRY